MANNVGTLIAASIRPFNSSDTFPTAYASELFGGYKSVSLLTDRDAIPTARRELGMVVFVVETGESYYLSGGIANTNWVKFVNPSYIAPITTAGTATNITGVDVTIKKSGATGGSLTVEGSATFQGSVSIAGSMTTTGNQSTNGDFSVSGKITGGTFESLGAAKLDGTLDVTGTSLFHSGSTFESPVVMQSSLGVTGATSLTSLTVSGVSTLASLSVAGNETVGGTLGVTGATSLTGNLSVTGITVLNSTLNVKSSADFDGAVNIDGSLTASAATFAGAVTTQQGLTVTTTSHLIGAVDIDATLNVDGNTTLGGTLGVTGAASLASTLDVTGIATFKNNAVLQKTLDVTLGTTLHGALSVEGDTTLVKNGTTGGKLTVNNTTTLNDTLTVAGAATLNSTLTVAGATMHNGNVTNYGIHTYLQKNASNAGGTLTVDGAAALNSTLSVTGGITASSATFSGLVTVQDGLSVLKASGFGDNLTVAKAVSVGTTLGVTGTSNLAGAVTMNSSASVGTTLTVVGATTLSGGLTVNGATSTGGLTTTGAASLQSTLSVTGATTLSGALTANSTSHFVQGVTADSTLSVAGATTLSSTLGVTGDATLGGKLTVTGLGYLKGNLMVDGTSTLNGAAQVNSVLSAVDFSVLAGDGKGYRFVDDNAKIYMSTTGAVGAGRLDTTSDANIYFRMTGGTNRGFVFQNGTTNLLQIEGSGTIKSQGDVYVYNNGAYVRLMRANEFVSGGGANADMTDGAHANLALDGTSGQLAVYDSNKRVYDSNRVGGYSPATAATANTVAIRDASGNLFVASKILASSNAIDLRNSGDTGWADLTVNNLTVKGTVTTVSSETVTIADNIVLLNSNVTGAASENGGIQVERGTTGADASLIWDETTDTWKAGLAGSETEISLATHTHTPASIGAVKNAGNVPELQSGLESARPAAGTTGRVYLTTDTKRIFQDTGSAWQVVGGQDTLDWSSITNKPVASNTTAGLVKIGANIAVAADGTISVATNPETFTIKRQEFVATQGQTDFTVTGGSWTVGTNAVTVYHMGDKLPNSAYTEVNNTTVRIKEGVDAGVLVEVEYMVLQNLFPYPVHASEHLPGGSDVIPAATTATNGLMSSADKTKLDGVTSGATKTASSATNGNIKVNDVETQVYRHQTYVFDQTATTSATWTITHNLNRYPSVTVVDINGDVFMPKNIRYNSANQITITFTAAESGKAFLN